MSNSLNTTSSGGSQTTTQNPQTATNDPNLTSSQSNLQSSQVNLLNSSYSTGVALGQASPSTVNLQASTTSVTPRSTPTVTDHHVNGVLLGLVIALFVVAMAIFWRTTLAAKSTTE
jgi:hypothetical protein